MLKKVLRCWKQYKYRFVPWLATNITESSPRLVSSTLEDKIIPDAKVVDSLTALFQSFSQPNNNQACTKSLHEINCKRLYEKMGFEIGRRASSIPDCGRGVFVTKGTVQPRTIVAMYPGLVNQPWEPVFWVSLGNPFLFRCADGIHIDGKDAGLSKMVYKSCARRDAVLGQLQCDISWHGENPINPLAIGQYVNNQNTECPANVAYQECDIQASFPDNLRPFLPNTEARLQQDFNSADIAVRDRSLRVVVLVSLREIQCDEELFSTYFTIVQNHSHNSKPP